MKKSIKVKLIKTEQSDISGTIIYDGKEYSFKTKCSDHADNRADVKKLILEEMPKHTPEDVVAFLEKTDDRHLAYRW